MMKNKILILIIGLVVVSAIWYYKSITIEELSDNVEMKNIEVKLGNNKLFIIPNIHGVSGNHQRITITEDNDSIYKKEVDYAFFTSEIYYRIENDKVIVYAPGSSVLEPMDSKSNLLKYVIVKPLKNAGEVNDYDKNYEKYNLKKVSVYTKE